MLLAGHVAEMIALNEIFVVIVALLPDIGRLRTETAPLSVENGVTRALPRYANMQMLVDVLPTQLVLLVLLTLMYDTSRCTDPFHA